MAKTAIEAPIASARAGQALNTRSAIHFDQRRTRIGWGPARGAPERRIGEEGKWTTKSAALSSGSGPTGPGLPIHCPTVYLDSVQLFRRTGRDRFADLA